MKTQKEILQDLIKASQHILSYSYSVPTWIDYDDDFRSAEIKKILSKINANKY